MKSVMSLQFFRFFIVSIANLLIDLLLITLLIKYFRIPDRLPEMIGLFPLVSQGEFLTRTIAFALTFFIAFFLQSRYTFKQNKLHGSQVRKYFLVTASLTVWQLFAFPSILHLLKVLFSHDGQASILLFYVSVIMAGATAMFLSYAMNRLWTFRVHA